MTQRITETDIGKLLQAKHHKDLYVPQCKNGASYGAPGTMSRMDGWAMARSWAHPVLTGYEIKCSRSDFLNDTKWRQYLPLCNEFYFAVADGVCDKSEVSAECGLITVSKNRSRLFTRKKAPYREIDPPVDVLIYILMCRSKITKESTESGMVEYWREWLRRRDEDKTFGYYVSKRIQEVVKARIDAVEVENDRLRTALERHADAAKILEQYGIGKTVESERGRYFVPFERWSVDKKVRELVTRIPHGLSEDLQRVAKAIDLLMEEKP